MHVDTEAPSSIAIMQPYLFPYIGYFQLLRSVDLFIFYDDVHYIKGGWINRNRILVNGTASYFTVELRGASPNRLINEVFWNDNSPKLLRTLQVAYARAPFFTGAYALVRECFSRAGPSIGDLAGLSVEMVAGYLGLQTRFERSAERHRESRGLGRARRLISIAKQHEANTYINAIGGREIYDEAEFKAEGVDLRFLEARIEPYRQFGRTFVPGLSMIDVLMFNSPDRVREMLEEGTLC